MPHQFLNVPVRDRENLLHQGGRARPRRADVREAQRLHNAKMRGDPHLMLGSHQLRDKGGQHAKQAQHVPLPFPNGLGQHLKIVDNNNDGIADYVFLTEYTLDKAISSYTKRRDPRDPDAETSPLTPPRR